MRPSRSGSNIPRGLIPVVITLVILSIPLVAMQYTREVQWDAFDFVVMGILLTGTGCAFEWLVRRPESLLFKLGAGVGVFSALLMTWVNMAVGLIGSEGSPVNGLLLLVPATGVIVALITRLRARGLAQAWLAMAAAQAALTWVALSEGWKPLHRGPIDLWAPNGLFVLLFLASALLFRAAATGQPDDRSGVVAARH